ncbi:hypothetical protein GobsT_66180 [Gemmata obscuriglobus]|uniref:Transposase n=1 Tax=Gemmata obscuriglobus TaxID=114 RepID=A0A2Z3GQY7_9BACT|nr:IS701 family transposase [Gemmata obscuriglobus]AWM35698.1 transposase [Gemmata obscuriglobus]QEG31774.1 hypothetical protein GobsT_66180 [Gemmata obscuriglobus]VTS11119.1 transposase : Transposase family protein OS=Singulisphaera acidiphila (strain ATCC BAA-1392 / DSM 18658 / VKM B-2454 / MOB10) GN=Sinac_0293 PE=4 SV=1: DDE_5 [Gemmata obscuriglobus UQM 2246]
MTEVQLEALGPALATFLEGFRAHFRSAPTFEHLRTYSRGLLSDLPRKTAEPVALAAGTPVRTLQEFLRDHRWDHVALGDDLHKRIARTLSTQPGDETGTVGLIDETSALKKGDRTPGVARQYLGCVGKVDNGIVTVHLGVARGSYRTLLDADLYLPADWSADRPRCQAAGLPDDVAHRPKWRMALEQVDRARTNGVHLDWLTFDSEYGKSPEFLRGLGERRQPFVGDVPSTFSCRVAARSGAQPTPGVKGQEARDVVRQAGAFRSQEWQILRLSRATAEDQVWRVKRARVWASGADGWSAGTYWLVWACSDHTGEEKFLVSNAPAECTAEALVRVGFRRAAVEHVFRICKSELGFTHFEGRNYVALRRHLCLCVAMLEFVAEHTQQLRGGKSPGDRGAGVPGPGPTEPRVARAGPGNDDTGLGAGGPRVPPAPQQGRHRVQTATRRSATHTQNTENAKTKTAGKVYS